ncbi:MAG TPA: hypothetical protein VF803_00425, partial [Candidatus Paceibacterota bacterium]
MASQFQDPFAKLFGSVARVRLMRLFLFHPKVLLTAADASDHVRVKIADARRELKLLCDAGFLRKTAAATPRYGMSAEFPFTHMLQQMLLATPLRAADLPERLRGCGQIKFVVLSGIFAGNLEGGLDILIVGERLNEKNLRVAMRTLEADIGTELKYTTLPTDDFKYRTAVSDRLIRDIFDYPHRIVID